MRQSSTLGDVFFSAQTETALVGGVPCRTFPRRSRLGHKICSLVAPYRLQLTTGAIKQRDCRSEEPTLLLTTISAGAILAQVEYCRIGDGYVLAPRKELPKLCCQVAYDPWGYSIERCREEELTSWALFSLTAAGRWRSRQGRNGRRGGKEVAGERDECDGRRFPSFSDAQVSFSASTSSHSSQ